MTIGDITPKKEKKSRRGKQVIDEKAPLLPNRQGEDGDVLSGTSSSGDHHAGVLEGWFGAHWWNGRAFILLVTTLGVFAPLACFKRIGHYAAHLMLVFPIVFYPLRLNLDGLLFPSSRALVHDNVRFTVITVSLISLIFMGANFIPSIWDAFQFTGATAAVCLGFIFPASITLRDRHNIATRRDKILCIFMIVLAVFSNLIAIYSDAYALIKKESSTRE
ncbi:hypothetical protein ACFE04_007454 [Oxalis oulophora]